MRKLFFILFIFSPVIAFTQPVTQEWVRRYSGLQPNIGSSGKSVKLDSCGNIYVLVRAASDSTNGDYGVLKYNSSGNLLWSAYYNTPGNLGEQSHAFTVTGSGDVYITGITGINFIYHILTVKFDSSGSCQWAKIYNGGGPGDDAYDIAVDRHGDIVLTGGSATINGSTSYSLVIKYSPNGDSLWVRKFTQLGIFNVTTKLVTDDSSNTYVTGYYQPDSLRNHFLTIKYDKSGSLMWYSTYYYDPGYQSDLAYCIAIDTNRNVYVAGISHTLSPGYNDNSLLKINPNGIIQWARVYKGIWGNNSCGQPAGVVTTPDGSRIYYVTVCENEAFNNSNFVTIAYNSIGDSVWVRRYPINKFGIPQNNPSSLKLDKSNNIYLTGSVYNQSSGDDYVTIKYLPDGTRYWVATFNGPLANSDDNANDLIIDTNFSVYVTGSSSRQNSPFLWDAATIKYNQVIGIKPNGNQLPREFVLEQNYPNPFNSFTQIKFDIPSIRGSKQMKVQLIIYNVLGQEVENLINKELEAGTYTYGYDASKLSSGVYFYRLVVNGGIIDTKKMVLAK